MAAAIFLGVLVAVALSAGIIAKSRRRPLNPTPHQPNPEWKFTVMPIGSKSAQPATKKPIRRKTTLRMVSDNQFTITKQTINPTGFCLYSGKSVKDCECAKHKNIA